MSIWHLIVLLLVVVVIFGTGKLRNIGSDLGSAIREFKKGLGDHEKDKDAEADRLRADSPAAENDAARRERERDSSESR